MATIDVPDGSLFGLDNLPYGVFSRRRRAARSGSGSATPSSTWPAALGTDGPDAAFAAPTLNPFMAQGRARWVAGPRAGHRAGWRASVPDVAVHAARAT